MRRDNQHSRLLKFCALPSPPSPAGLASFLLGASLIMMLGGSMTFLVGFLLLPWVIGFAMVLYLVGIVSSLSGLGRAILSLFWSANLERQGGVRGFQFFRHQDYIP